MNRFNSICLAAIVLAFVFSGCGKRLTEEQMRAQALNAENEEKWDEAINWYEKIVKTYPKSEKAGEELYKLGMLYANHQKDFEKSVDAYKRLIEKYPDSRHAIQSLFMIGYRYANDIGDLEKARQAYEEFMKKYPDHELASSVAWELENLGKDISDIETQLGQAASENP